MQVSESIDAQEKNMWFLVSPSEAIASPSLTRYDLFVTRKFQLQC